MRGSQGPQSAFGLGAPTQLALSWSTYGSGVVVSETSSRTYSVFNASGSNIGWTKGANTTNAIKAPFTLVMRKNGQEGDMGNAYAMAGVLPASLVNTMRADSSESYNYGYNHYPVNAGSDTSYYERRQTDGVQTSGSLGPWDSGDTFYVTVERNGAVKYWRFGNLLRTSVATPGIDWLIQVNNYSANTTWGGFYDIKVFKDGIWNGSSVEYQG
jgi:hypothetical protein